MNQDSGRYFVFQDNQQAMVMFGIALQDGARVGHISSDYAQVANLAERCNQGALSPVHLRDVVEDFQRC